MFSSLHRNRNKKNDQDCIIINNLKRIKMIPNSSQHILNRLFTEQREYCSDKNIKGVYFIERMIIRV